MDGSKTAAVVSGVGAGSWSYRFYCDMGASDKVFAETLLEKYIVRETWRARFKKGQHQPKGAWTTFLELFFTFSLTFEL